MLPSQRHLFDMPREVAYLNAAAWSPLPLASVEAGQAGAARKARPWELTDAFQEHQVERARAAAATMIRADASDVAIIPSVGYGVSTAAKILDLPRGSRILVLDRDHTAPVLEWMSRAEAMDYRIETVSAGVDHDWTAALEEALAKPGQPPAALVSISNIHWSDGGLIDLNRVKQTLRPHDGKLLVDATHGEITLTAGLGARHWAAAAITKATNAVAIVVSESNGTVRLFQNGEVLLRVEPLNRRPMKWKDFEYEPPKDDDD